jgi:hypothetical protein
MSDSAGARLRRAAEVALYVPFGLVAYARDVGPMLLNVLVSRGRGEVDRQVDEASARLRHVKAVTDAAIAFRLQKPQGDTGDRAATSVDARDVPSVEAETAATGSVEGVTIADGTGREVDGLAIPGYDALSAGQVVARLSGLDPEQLAAVQRYESTHRRRQTILGKIDQLTA